MSKKMKKAFVIVLALVLVASLLLPMVINVFAQDPYEGYYKSKGGEIAAPNGYLPTKTYNGSEWGIGYFNTPNDLYVDVNDNLYILDSKNGRVIKTDSEFNVLKVISNFTLDGAASPLNNPMGICVTTDGEIYIADTDGERVIAANEDGVIRKVFGKPESHMIDPNLSFKPKKLEVTPTGDMYIVADGMVDGALIITEEGEFKGFYATDVVEMTGEMIKVVFWRMIMTEEQIAKMLSPQPEPFHNLYLSGDFLYTASTKEKEAGQIRKVNPASKNLFDGYSFGEMERYYDESDWTNKIRRSSFVDVNVSEKDFVYALDKQFGRIYVYNQQNELLLNFGGTLDAEGHFKSPAAIETIGDKVIVLDSIKGNITIFEPTYYGSKIMEASYLYDHGLYEQAIEPWNEVLKHNTNSDLAYQGKARALYLAGEYSEAMKHYKAAGDQEGYSEARQKLRADYITNNFSTIVVIGLLIVIALSLLFKYKEKILRKCGFKFLSETGYAGMAKWKYPFYNLLHPSTGMTEMYYNKKESLPLGILFAFLWYASAVIIRQYEDFVFLGKTKPEINIFMIFATTIGILMVGCISNWAITTLVDGKGTFKNIFIYASYSLIPSTVAAFIVTVISHYMISTEAIFVQAILFIGYAWTALMLFMSIITVHDFTTKKSIITVILTVLGMLIIVFLLMLLVVLYSQVSSFVTTVAYEIFYRFNM